MLTVAASGGQAPTCPATRPGRARPSRARALRGAVALSVALSVVAGCGTSESDVHDAVRQSALDGGLTGVQADDVADCAAPRLVKELSEQELTQLVEHDKVTGTRNAVVDKVLADCLADAVG